MYYIILIQVNVSGLLGFIILEFVLSSNKGKVHLHPSGSNDNVEVLIVPRPKEERIKR